MRRRDGATGQGDAALAKANPGPWGAGVVAGWGEGFGGLGHAHPALGLMWLLTCGVQALRGAALAPPQCVASFSGRLPFRPRGGRVEGRRGAANTLPAPLARCGDLERAIHGLGAGRPVAGSLKRAALGQFRPPTTPEGSGPALGPHQGRGSSLHDGAVEGGRAKAMPFPINTAMRVMSPDPST